LPVVNTGQKTSNLPSSRINDPNLAHLTAEQKHEFLILLDEFAYVFHEKPGLCKVGMHEMRVTPDFKPKRMKAYRVPDVLKPKLARYRPTGLIVFGIYTPIR